MRLLACTETVTLVRHRKNADADWYECEAIVGVSWFAKAGSNPGPNGETPTAELSVRIPADLVPDELPKPGDLLVHGALGTYDGNRRELAELEYYQIKTVGDNRRSALLPHVVLKG